MAQTQQTPFTYDPAELLVRVTDWLINEAALLDSWLFDEWCELLDEDLRYLVPVRESLENGTADRAAFEYFHLEENRSSMQTRAKRLCLPSAWAEDPPSRTRRFVTNIRARTRDEGFIGVQSYVLLTRSRGHFPEYELLTCERQDVLRPIGDDFRLVQRTVAIDQATVGMMNLAQFL